MLAEVGRGRPWGANGTRVRCPPLTVPRLLTILLAFQRLAVHLARAACLSMHSGAAHRWVATVPVFADGSQSPQVLAITNQSSPHHTHTLQPAFVAALQFPLHLTLSEYWTHLPASAGGHAAPPSTARLQFSLSLCGGG